MVYILGFAEKNSGEVHRVAAEQKVPVAEEEISGPTLQTGAHKEAGC